MHFLLSRITTKRLFSAAKYFYTFGLLLLITTSNTIAQSNERAPLEGSHTLVALNHNRSKKQANHSMVMTTTSSSAKVIAPKPITLAFEKDLIAPNSKARLVASIKDPASSDIIIDLTRDNASIAILNQHYRLLNNKMIFLKGKKEGSTNVVSAIRRPSGDRSSQIGRAHV